MFDIMGGVETSRVCDLCKKIRKARESFGVALAALKYSFKIFPINNLETIKILKTERAIDF